MPPKASLLLSGLVEGRVLEKTTSVVDLDNVTVTGEFSTSTLGNIFFTRVLGESPLGRLQNLLASGKLELSSTNGFDDVGLSSILGANTQQDLADIDTGGNTDRLTVGMSHSRRQSIGTGTRKHFVGTKDVEGVGAHANVVGILSNGLTQVLVDGNTASFEGFRGNLLLLVTDQVGNEWEQIDGGLLVPDIENLNLRFWHTTAVPRLDVRLVLLVSVATSWTATHGEIYFLLILLIREK